MRLIPGCVSTGKTWEKIQQNIREAIAFHVESLIEYGDPVPEPHISVEEAMAFHAESLAKSDEPVPELETTVGMVEVEVSQVARAS